VARRCGPQVARKWPAGGPQVARRWPAGGLQHVHVHTLPLPIQVVSCAAACTPPASDYSSIAAFIIQILRNIDQPFPMASTYLLCDAGESLA
jgi:hypothetical protein